MEKQLTLIEQQQALIDELLRERQRDALLGQSAMEDDHSLITELRNKITKLRNK